MYIKKICGPRTMPCGTPILISIGGDSKPFANVIYFLFVRLNLNKSLLLHQCHSEIFYLAKCCDQLY